MFSFDITIIIIISFITPTMDVVHARILHAQWQEEMSTREVTIKQ